MDMKYGQIAESLGINQAIYDCFIYLEEKEQKKFVKKFREQPHSRIQVMHTFHELLLGTFLSKKNFIVENDRKIDNKTPDWSLLDINSKIIGIVEMVNHHIDNKTNQYIVNQFKAGKKAVAYFPHGNDPDNNHLYSHIHDKACKYNDLVIRNNVPYVIATFIDFLASIDIQETTECVLGGSEPLFKQYPDISGVLHFAEANYGTYRFSYIENPYSIRRIAIPSGLLLTN